MNCPMCGAPASFHDEAFRQDISTAAEPEHVLVYRIRWFTCERCPWVFYPEVS